MDADTRTRLVGLFVDEAQENLATLEQLVSQLASSYERGHAEQIAQIAHGLKGAAAAVGIAELVPVFHQLEALALGTREASEASRGDALARLARGLPLLHTVIGGISAGSAIGGDAASLKRLLEQGALANGAREPRKAEPTSAEAPAAAPALAEGTLERLSVPSSEVDEALRLAASISRLASAFNEQLAAHPALASGSTLGRMASEVAGTSDRLEELLFGLRLIPAADAMAGLGDEVRALGTRLGKGVRFVLSDRDVRADRRTLQTARGLVRHLVRNAMDHGLEPPAARLAAGKPESGRLMVTLAVAESRLQVAVEDDGRGFDVPAIRRKLRERGVDPAHLEALSDPDVLAEFAAAGGSTRDVATDISGRGLGLSAVLSMVRGKGGDFKIKSRAGEGTRIEFSVPLDVYTVDALTARWGDRWYAFPVGAVDRTVPIGLGGQRVQEVPGGAILSVDERLVTLVPLKAALAGTIPDRLGRFAVVVRAEGREAAFGVDELGEPVRVIPQALAPAVGPNALISGVALLPDGAQVQVLNPGRLLERGRSSVAPARPEVAPASARKKLTLLLAEDSLATREVLRVLLEREGFEVRVASDGEEALARLSESLPDVVVSDFNMPRRDGPSLARAIRASARTARLPVVLLTSQDDAASKAAGAAAGADAYLIKSEFNAAVLKSTLRRLGVEE